MIRLAQFSFILFTIAFGVNGQAGPCAKPPQGFEWFFANEGRVNTSQIHSWAKPDQVALEVEIHMGFQPMAPEELIPFEVYEVKVPLFSPFEGQSTSYTAEGRTSRYLGADEIIHPLIDGATEQEGSLLFTDRLPLPPDLRSRFPVVRKWCGRRLLGAPASEERMSILVWSETNASLEPFVIKINLGHSGFASPTASVVLSDHIETGLRGTQDPGFHLFPERYGLRLLDQSSKKTIYSMTYRRLRVVQAPRGPYRIAPLSVVLGDPGELRRIAALDGLSPGEWKRKILLPKFAKACFGSLFKVGVLGQNHVQNTDLMIATEPPPRGESWTIGVALKDVRDMVVAPSFSLLFGREEHRPNFPLSFRTQVHWMNDKEGEDEVGLALTNIALNGQEYAGQVILAMSESPEEIKEFFSLVVGHFLYEFRSLLGDFPRLTTSTLNALSLLDMPEDILETYALSSSTRRKRVYAHYRALWKNADERELQLRHTGLWRHASGQALQGIHQAAWMMGTDLAFRTENRRVARGGEPAGAELIDRVFDNIAQGRYFWTEQSVFVSPTMDARRDLLFAHKKMIVPLGSSQFVFSLGPEEDALLPQLITFDEPAPSPDCASEIGL